eukprot:gene36121-14361_t
MRRGGVSAVFAAAAAAGAAAAPAAAQWAQPKHDCGGVADTNSLAVLALLLSPAVRVIGKAPNYAHCLRAVEVAGRASDVPVQLTWEREWRTVEWKGQWSWNPNSSAYPNPGPDVLLPPSHAGYTPMREGCTPRVADA